MGTKLRIALIGTRGIPARYGGFETFAEEISKRLVERGHEVTVYTRHKLFTAKPNELFYNDVRVRSTATIMHKYLETPLSALTAFLDLFRRKYDVVLLCNAANSPFSWLVRMRGLPLLINVDGVERHRAKWNALGKAWYRLGEYCSLLFASKIIADAEVIADYYKETYKAETTVIPYGASAIRKDPGITLQELGLKPKSYILYVSRLEPENNALGVIKAYRSVESEFPLVIVGDAPYAENYKKLLREAADRRVIFAGYRFGDAYHELQSNCYLYIQATEVGGTHPALIESMSYGNCVIANGTPENLEVIGDGGVAYPKNDFDVLSRILNKLINDPSEVSALGNKARIRANQKYSWQAVTDAYENLLINVAS